MSTKLTKSHDLVVILSVSWLCLLFTAVIYHSEIVYSLDYLALTTRSSCYPCHCWTLYKCIIVNRCEVLICSVDCMNVCLCEVISNSVCLCAD